MRVPVRTGAVGRPQPVAGARSGVGRLQNATKNSQATPGLKGKAAIKRRGTDFRSRF